MRDAIIALLVLATLFALSNPALTKERLGKILPKGRQPAVDDTLEGMGDLVPERNRPHIAEANKALSRFKAELAAGREKASFERLQRLKGRVMNQLYKATFFLPNDMDKEMKLRGKISHVENIMQSQLYYLFGQPFDTFSYTPYNEIYL